MTKSEHIFNRIQLDMRPLIRWLYPNTPVTELLCSHPLHFTPQRIRMFVSMIREIIYEEGIRFLSTPNYPYSLSVEITNACNLRCKMCNLIKMKRSPQMMGMEIYMKIIDRCSEANIRSIRLHTYGETLLHPELVPMLNYARNAGISVWISTNGLLLTEEKAKAILMTGVRFIRFSLEGANAKTYEAIRVGGKFDLLLHNMQCLKRLRDKINPMTRIGINTVLMKDTLSEICLIERVYGPYVDEIEISALEGIGNIGMKISEKQFLETVNLSKRIPCRLLWDMMNINVEGKATICCVDVESDYVVGDALKEDLISIWKGKTLEKFRQLQRKRCFEEMKICSNCSFGVTNTAWNRFRYALLNDRSSYGIGSIQ